MKTRMRKEGKAREEVRGEGRPEDRVGEGG